MKCRYCKAEIPEGELYCKKCGREVQIVPDYNPLEEMLTAQIQLDGNEQESELEFWQRWALKMVRSAKLWSGSESMSIWQKYRKKCITNNSGYDWKKNDREYYGADANWKGKKKTAERKSSKKESFAQKKTNRPAYYGCNRSISRCRILCCISEFL